MRNNCKEYNLGNLTSSLYPNRINITILLISSLSLVANVDSMENSPFFPESPPKIIPNMDKSFLTTPHVVFLLLSWHSLCCRFNLISSNTIFIGCTWDAYKKRADLQFQDHHCDLLIPLHGYPCIIDQTTLDCWRHSFLQSLGIAKSSHFDLDCRKDQIAAFCWDIWPLNAWPALSRLFLSISFMLSKKWRVPSCNQATELVTKLMVLSFH